MQQHNIANYAIIQRYEDKKKKNPKMLAEEELKNREENPG